MKKGIYINDSVHGLIALTEYEKRIVSTIGFNRLHDVYQNSTVYLTFPTNRIKRFEHSIGTMKLCSDMFFQSLLNTTESMSQEFFGIFEKEYQSILEEIGADIELCDHKLGGKKPVQIPHIKLDKLRHSLIPNNISEEHQVLYLILIQSIRAAALLHDIGHPPFSHIVEFALHDVYQEYKDQPVSDKRNVKEFVDIMSKYFEGDKKLHEQMGDEISEGILHKIITPLTNEEADKEENQYEENVFELLVLESVKHIFEEIGAFSDIHRILDSSLDGDRLDYVTRDAIGSGRDLGKIDYSRIITDMQMIVDQGKIYFCVPLKVISAVEDFVKRRYDSYKEIIYHHRVIKTDYILEGIFKDLVRQYLEQPVSKEQPDSEVLIPFNISGLWFPLGDKKSAIKANALSQWNDSWLMTVLRQIYYLNYYHNTNIKEDSKEYILLQRLAELLRNSKRYHSLIKRSEIFKIIDDAVKQELYAHLDELEQLLLDQIVCLAKDGQSGHMIQQSVISGKEEKTKDFKEYELIQIMIDKTRNNSSGFILSHIARYYEAHRKAEFESMVRTIVDEQTKEIVTDLKTYETVTLFKRISLGLNSPIYFYDHKGNISTLTELSGIADILQLDSDYLPVFYIYILAKDNDGYLREKREELLTSIGRRIGEELLQKMRQKDKS